MRGQSEKCNPYRAELTRLTRLLADPTRAALAPDLAGADPTEVRSFAEDNRVKRLRKLAGQLEFLSDAFDDLNAHLENYVAAGPLHAYDTIGSDADRFLNWLEQTGQPSAEQRDHIDCQRARQAVARKASQARLAYVNFQDILSVTGPLVEQVHLRRDLRIHLNPAHAWTRLRTRVLLDDEEKIPQDVVFFAVGTEIRTAMLSDECRLLVHVFAGQRPASADEWLYDAAATELPDASSFLEHCRQLMEIGLIALG